MLVLGLDNVSEWIFSPWRAPNASQDVGPASFDHTKVFIPQITCAVFCDAFNMLPLSPNDDITEGDRQKTQGGGTSQKEQ